MRGARVVDLRARERDPLVLLEPSSDFIVWVPFWGDVPLCVELCNQFHVTLAYGFSEP